MTDTQKKAMELLLLGLNQTDTAREVGITRETLNRWVNGDEHFIAEMNLCRKELRDGHIERLRSLAGKAMDAISALLDCDDNRTRLTAATWVLSAVGLDALPAPSGKTTAGEIRAEQDAGENDPLTKLLKDLSGAAG